jgi:RNA polymerase sigma factor (sigma-70 family)
VPSPAAKLFEDLGYTVIDNLPGELLSDLAELDKRQAEIVEMRFFAGLTVEEIAEVLEISPATVKREWATAKMWLRRQMQGL